MNFIGLAFLLVGALTQTTQAQCYRSCGCAPSIAVPAAVTSVPGTTIIQTPSVANALADTLSLLTVSSLLADTLPFSCGCGPVVSVPAVPSVGYSGCGLSTVPALSYDGFGLPTVPAISYSGCGLPTVPAVSYSGCGLPTVPAVSYGCGCGCGGSPCWGRSCRNGWGYGYDILI